ncbi:MAG TPA: anhydro-N-acetylmuramic acid kinase [Ohtaekwangia sp.]|uniref:anhydro-N-acetylmuramic acid kinase n=1 Tax=Ohtaekwangia sp. TaxID=2066019 RepID=UPI002F940BE9
MDSKNNYKVIGLMSGTSLDGLDIAYCQFNRKDKGWSYSINKATTLKYPVAWINKLSSAQNLSGEELIALDVAYGKFLGKACADFIRRHSLKADFIASHGHTIFHQPQRSFTYQLGSGQALHVASGLPVVYDFRSLDVLLGGEGAPLVPAGDKFLFSEYDVCLNLGGIANLSMDAKGKRIAYDVCFMNMGLNYLAAKAGKEFDVNGTMAQDGEVNNALWKALAKIYSGLRKKRPSLGRELFEKQIKSLLDDESISLNDRLRTFTESSAAEIASVILSSKEKAKVLCTGGGALNSFFILRLLELCGDHATLIIPEEEIVKFKEAMAFAFLGVLRVRNEVNCLQSVTHATRNSSSGITIGF